MKETDYAGIDYGLGQSNVDTETGIRYGMISQNSVSSYGIEDIYRVGDDIGFEEMRKQAKNELAQAIASALEDYGQVGDPDELAAEIIDNAVEWHDRDESGPYWFEDEGYSLQTTSNNELWVFKSNFYTHAQFCSPCVPGAGNLDTYCADGPKTYCLGHDWFEDNKAPYPVYRVIDNTIVEP